MSTNEPELRFADNLLARTDGGGATRLGVRYPRPREARPEQQIRFPVALPTVETLLAACAHPYEHEVGVGPMHMRSRRFSQVLAALLEERTDGDIRDEAAQILADGREDIAEHR